MTVEKNEEKWWRCVFDWSPGNLGSTSINEVSSELKPSSSSLASSSLSSSSSSSSLPSWSSSCCCCCPLQSINLWGLRYKNIIWGEVHIQNQELQVSSFVQEYFSRYTHPLKPLSSGQFIWGYKKNSNQSLVAWIWSSVPLIDKFMPRVSGFTRLYSA